MLPESNMEGFNNADVFNKAYLCNKYGISHAKSVCAYRPAAL